MTSVNVPKVTPAGPANRRAAKLSPAAKRKLKARRQAERARRLAYEQRYERAVRRVNGAAGLMQSDVPSRSQSGGSAGIG